ncbi:MAG: hypothetical protein PF443_01720 [Allgaiera sp.]|jgi:flagellar motor switch protein FliG|nr:hypothetical protein [Allgaiera sp.]
MTTPAAGMNGATMAAYVVMSMDENAASEVLRHMDESAIGTLTTAMAAMHEPASDQAYQIYARLMTDLESNGGMAPGGYDAFRKLLARAFGEKRANDMLERIIRTSATQIDVLSKVDPKVLAEVVKDERPQVVAVLLGQMTRSNAVECLNAFDETLAVDLIHRFARLDTIPSVALAELKGMLSEQLGTQVETRTSSTGGVRQAADLLNGMSSGAADRALSQIREADSDLADQIRSNMFTFDDLLSLPDNFLQLVIFEVNPERRAPALRGGSTVARERFLHNISRKEAEILKDDIDHGPMVTRAESQSAQHEFVEAAMRLSRDGRISLRNDEDMI